MPGFRMLGFTLGVAGLSLASVFAGLAEAATLLAQAPATADADLKTVITWVLLASVSIIAWFLRGTLEDLRGAIGKLDAKIGTALDRVNSHDVEMGKILTRMEAVEKRCSEHHCQKP